MDLPEQRDHLLAGPAPILALAPMQDITDLPFWRVQASYGGADLYFTEYFRVYTGSVLDKHILRSIVENPTGRPVIAQLIGNDIPSLVRTARELQRFPVAGIDLNLGCPAPIVYRKCAGGGLLRDPVTVDRILGALRESIQLRFTVKTRVGFESPDLFPELLQVFNRHCIDLLTVHARTVKDSYHGAVRYEFVREAVSAMNCPVLANGNIVSAEVAEQVLRSTGAAGLMLGRSAVRNPWLFRQIRQRLSGQEVSLPLGCDVLDYVQALWTAATDPVASENSQVQRIKKHMNFVGLGIDPEKRFLHEIQRVQTKAGFFAICERFLRHDRPMPLEPFPAVGPATQTGRPWAKQPE